MDDGNRQGVTTRLTLEAPRKEYDRGRAVAVEDLSLDVEGGEFITVVGPSSCGKSVTLHMVTRLESPSGGTTRIGGEDVTDQHARKRDVVMVLQNYVLYPHKTAMQDMVFGLRMSANLPKDERREYVCETATMMGIEDFLDDKSDEFLGGQKQRVTFGRVIVREPDMFLLDEPLSNLDAKLRTTIWAETQRLQNELGITSLYVTHDQEEVMMMGDKIVTLNDGKLQQAGRLKDVYENPANEFVGGLVGSPSMNFLDVLVEYEGDRLVLAGDSLFSYHLSRSSLATFRETTDVTDLRVGIRLEDVVTASSSGNVADSTVSIIEPTSSDNYLHLGIGPGFIIHVDLNVEPETGETIGVTFDESDLHVFHPRTGESLLSRESKRRAAPMQQV